MTTLVGQPSVAAVIVVGGACNLIAAIEAANSDMPVGSCPAGSGADVIELNADVELTAANNTTRGPNGLPVIYTEVEIDGLNVEIARQAGSPPFRIFNVASNGKLTLRRVEVKAGLAFADVSDDVDWSQGGGIYNRGSLYLIDSLVTDNEALSAAYIALGGGIYSRGPVSLVNVIIDGNRARSDSFQWGAGGGVYVSIGGADGASLPFALRVIGSTFSNNVASSQQSSARGGAIYDFSLAGSSIEGSEIFNNFAVTEAFPAHGGGIWSRSNLDLSNTTISSNFATSRSGTEAQGGGAWLRGRTEGPGSTVRQVTFRSNVVGPRPPSVGAALAADQRVTVSGSVFSASTGSHCAIAFEGTGNLIDGGGNLADSATCAPTIATTLNNVDPALADNGGPTRTHALVGASTAIDVAGSCGAATDQRGAARIPPCDAGAFEALGCALLELDVQFVNDAQEHAACNTALVGPALVVQMDGGLKVTAGHLIAVKNDFIVLSGGELELGIDPALLPP